VQSHSGSPALLATIPNDTARLLKMAEQVGAEKRTPLLLEPGRRAPVYTGICPGGHVEASVVSSCLLALPYTPRRQPGIASSDRAVPPGTLRRAERRRELFGTR